MFTYTLFSPNNGCYRLYFQKMSKIPSLMELQSLPRFRKSCLKNYSCVMCGKVFERERYLKDHIHSVHIKSLGCDFCDYRVAPRRRKRLEDHMRKRHNFPAPPCSFLVPQPAADISYSNTVYMQPPISEAYSETACAKIVAPTDRTFESSVCEMSESVSCITSSPPSNVVSFPVPSRCLTP